tara:strand:- start:50 stop:664 length:615 start_codon:yes stop_codon:yes gene_type:complete
VIRAEIHGIFPVPLYRSKLSRKFTKRELHFVEKMRAECRPNMGNTTSSNGYVLNEPSFSILKKKIDLFIEDYFAKIIFPPKAISPYITQSWLNYTEINEHHHPHHHSNSYLSGILYIAADKDHDNITFGHNRYDQINISPTQGNEFNSIILSFPVETGEIIIFPSSLMHSVSVKKGKNRRISLSFNVFVKGNLGQVRDSNELKL